MRTLLARAMPAASGLAWAAVSVAQTSLPPTQLPIDPSGLGIPATVSRTVQDAIRRDDWRTAEASLFSEAQRNTSNADLQRALGIAHFQAHHYLAAAAALRRADRVVRLDSEARFLLATAHLRLGRGHWARAELETLVDSEPEQPRYRLALARLHYEGQRFLAGAEQLRSALERAPRLPEARDLLGQCLEGLGQAEAAEAEYRAAIALNAQRGAASPWPHYHLGSMLHDLGDLSAARGALQAAATADPRHVSTLVELGIVLAKMSELRPARTALEAARRERPDDPRIHYALAKVYRQLGLEELARGAAARFRALASDGR
ncbi:MAG: tetratricopeptide repeat protein [Bryobacterales bacterium]|nr:tetratricopeptide repeat protein [Bryobacterales bacterium]